MTESPREIGGGPRQGWLEQLPLSFTSGELRARFGLTLNVACHLCREWKQAGRVRQAGRGFYVRLGGRPAELPLVMHRAAASGPGGYLTGAYALARHRLLLEAPPRVDVVVPGRAGPDLPWEGFTIRRLCLGLAAFTAGLETLRDGEREITLAGPERVLVDALSHPGKILTVQQTARLFRERKAKLRQARLLDLVVRLGSEAVFRRMRVMAEHAGMLRLGRWLREEGGIRPAMGRTRLDPAAPVPPGAPVRFGVILNVPLDGAGPETP